MKRNTTVMNHSASKDLISSAKDIKHARSHKQIDVANFLEVALRPFRTKTRRSRTSTRSWKCTRARSTATTTLSKNSIAISSALRSSSTRRRRSPPTRRGKTGCSGRKSKEQTSCLRSRMPSKDVSIQDLIIQQETCRTRKGQRVL